MRKIAAAALWAATMSCALTVPARAEVRDDSEETLGESEPQGSPYLQCDGRPNNRTAGIGIVSLFGFENTMRMAGYEDETPSPAARLVGKAGVDACTFLVEGDRAEGNAIRRMELILARALHQIEADDLAAAEADLELFRRQAGASGLTGDPYFEVTLGLSQTRIEAAIAMARGDLAQAQQLLTDGAAGHPFSMLAQGATGDMTNMVAGLEPAVEARLESLARLMPGAILIHADRLQGAGRFSEAANKLERLLVHSARFFELGGDATTLAETALAQALAGNIARSVELEIMARDAKSAEISRAAAASESFTPDHRWLDQTLRLLDIWQRAEDGQLEEARQMFLERDDWRASGNAPLFVLIDRLREDLPPERQTGPLQYPAAVWRERIREELLDRALSSDTLFRAIVPYSDPNEWEDRSRKTYRLKRSRFMEPAKGMKDVWQMFVFDHPPSAADAILLHAALQAQDRGYDGFQIVLRMPRGEGKYALTSARLRFANAGDADVDSALWISADDVIARLGSFVPPRDEIGKHRRARRGR